MDGLRERPDICNKNRGTINLDFIYTPPLRSSDMSSLDAYTASSGIGFFTLRAMAILLLQCRDQKDIGLRLGSREKCRLLGAELVDEHVLLFFHLVRGAGQVAHKAERCCGCGISLCQNVVLQSDERWLEVKADAEEACPSSAPRWQRSGGRPSQPI